MPFEGIRIARKTFISAKLAVGWVVEEPDESATHQASQVPTQAFIKALGIDPARC